MKLRWQATRGTCLHFLKRDPQAAEMRAAPTLRSITAPELDFSKILELHIEMTDQMPVCLGIELSPRKQAVMGALEGPTGGPPGRTQGTCDCLGDALFNSMFGRR